MDRREFLWRSALAAAALSVSPLEAVARGGWQLERKGASKKVVVLGAGLAGLSAAYELTRAGHDVSILEARTRAGGRVHTRREPFAEGQHAEEGAARIPAEHELVLKYAAHFGLALEEFYPRDSFVHYRRGKRDVIKWKEFEKRLWQYFELRLGPDPSKVLKIKGGNDLLPKAFEARLARKIIYNAAVVRVAQDARGVEVTFAPGGVRESLRADYAICTLPFTMLRRVEVSPPLSEEKRKVVAGLKYDAASRVLVQVKRGFWDEKRLSGFGVTDDPMEIWQPTFTQPGAHAVFTTYPRHELSERLTAMPEEERVRSAVELLERVFPGARANFVVGLSKSWQEDEWAGGAWAHPDEKLMPIITRPEGRIHFAGEHTSARWPSWMQGALESGNRAAREVNDASPESASHRLFRRAA